MSKRIKHLMAKELADGLKDSDSCVVLGIGKFGVQDAVDLRGCLREEGLKLRVLKNRVSKYAFKELGWDGLEELLSGASALAYGGENGALVASKLLVDWEKKSPNRITIRGGLLEGKILDEAEVRQLATIPDKPTLYAMLASTVVAPVTSVANLVNDMIAGVARAVGAVAEKSEGGA
jgi:large subunit ribosomal protein L10